MSYVSDSRGQALGSTVLRPRCTQPLQSTIATSLPRTQSFLLRAEGGIRPQLKVNEGIVPCPHDGTTPCPQSPVPTKPLRVEGSGFMVNAPQRVGDPGKDVTRVCAERWDRARVDALMSTGVSCSQKEIHPPRTTLGP